MWNYQTGKIGIFGALLTTTLHYGSHAYVSTERILVEAVKEKQIALVDNVAQTFGYEKPKPVASKLGRREIVVHEAIKRKVNPSFALALLEVESSGKQYAESPAGALGLMQVMPENLKRCGLSHSSQLFDEESNIRCGVQIISEELATYNNDAVKALYAYNGGPRAVKVIASCGTENHRCLGDYTESVQHARKVVNLMARDIS